MLKVHSEVGLITNSSTVVYTWATRGTLKATRELINGILKIAGSDKTCDDLFDMKLVKGEEYGSPFEDSNWTYTIRLTDKQGNELKSMKALLGSIDGDGFNDNF